MILFESGAERALKGFVLGDTTQTTSAIWFSLHTSMPETSDSYEISDDNYSRVETTVGSSDSTWIFADVGSIINNNEIDFDEFVTARLPTHFGISETEEGDLLGAGVISPIITNAKRKIIFPVNSLILDFS